MRGDYLLTTQTLFCGYSHHAQPFQINYIDSLPTYLLRLQTEGSCKALIRGKMHTIRSGDLIIFRPGESYQLEVDVNEEAPYPEKVYSSDYYVMCRGSWIDTWWARQHRPQVVRIDPDEKLLSIWRLLILEKRRLNVENIELSNYLLRSLLLVLDQAMTTPHTLKGKTFIASRMKRYIEEHATVPFKLEELAKNVDLSVSRAVHLFKENFEKTIIQYTHEVRLSLAEERMKYSKMTLEQIADSCGFGSYSHFFRVFRSHYGMSPAMYREMGEVK